MRINQLAVLTLIFWFAFLTGNSSFGLSSRLIIATEITPTPTMDISLIGKTSICPGYLAVIKAFYDANDEGRYDDSLNLLKEDASVATWGEGVHGRHWQETHLTGRNNIRAVLGNRGFRRILAQPDTPIYQDTEFQIKNNQVDFYLRPDRLGPDGRPHNPYEVTATIDDCKIQTLQVIEWFTSP